MYLNTIRPMCGARIKRRRVGRGIGSTLGKTCGRGHKGQHARAGGYHKVGFEGGQMPLQRRLPKVGFKSPKKSLWAQIGTSSLQGIPADCIDIVLLKEARLISGKSTKVKVIASGPLEKAIFVKGLSVSSGARKLIESVGGKIEV